MLPTAYKAIDKAMKRGVIKKNTAARKKSRLAPLSNAHRTDNLLCPGQNRTDIVSSARMSYPLNDGGNVECISEPEPPRHKVGERVMMLVLVNTL